MPRFRSCCSLLLWLTVAVSHAQAFRLITDNDSLSRLTLGSSEWPLPYPVYQFQTGDVDGDGRNEALVGVVKKTRFHQEKALDGRSEHQMQRRLFVFKDYHGLVRPLWLGSRLGGVLEDFRFTDGLVLTLEVTGPYRYSVGHYRWQHFGFGFEQYLVRDTTLQAARTVFDSRAQALPNKNP